MELLDEDGRILGVVNVVDALVVLVVFALAVAAIALVLPDGEDRSPELETTYATLDLGTQPAYIVPEIEEGDTYSPAETEEIEITDVFVTPGQGGSRVLLRVELTGPVRSEAIQFAGEPPRLGRSLEITTPRYEVSGTIREVGATPTLPTVNRTVVVRDTIDRRDATRLRQGAEITIAGHPVATVREVASFPRDDPDRQTVLVEASVRAVTLEGEALFGGEPVRRGRTLSLRGDQFVLAGTIERVGAGTRSDQTDVLLRTTIPDETVQALSEGDTATIRGRTVGTVESVTTYGTNDPRRKRTFVGLTLHTAEIEGRQYFGDVQISNGQQITFRTEEYAFTGSIQRVGHLEQRGTQTTRTVTISADSMSEERARGMGTALTERADGQVIARVTNVSVEPVQILVRGDGGQLEIYDHPTKRDVKITADVTVRQTTSGLEFKGEPIRHGSSVILDLGTVTVRGTITSIQ